MYRKLTKAGALVAVSLFLAGCAPGKRPFLMVRMCLSNQQGTEEFVNELKSIAADEKLEFIDNSGNAERGLKETGYVGRERTGGSRVMDIRVVGGNDMEIGHHQPVGAHQKTGAYRCLGLRRIENYAHLENFMLRGIEQNLRLIGLGRSRRQRRTKSEQHAHPEQSAHTGSVPDGALGRRLFQFVAQRCERNETEVAHYRGDCTDCR